MRVLGALLLGRGLRDPAAAGAAAARHDQHDRGRCWAGRPRRRPRCARLLDVAERGEMSEHLVRRSVLKVEYDPDRPGERGMFFGAAGIYDGIHLCTGSIHTRGLTGSWASTSTILTILGRALLRGGRGDRHRRRRDRHQHRRRRRGRTGPRAPGAGDHAGPAGPRHAPVLEQRRGADPFHRRSTIRPSASSGTPGESCSAASQRDLPDPPFHSRGGSGSSCVWTGRSPSTASSSGRRRALRW